MNNGKEKTNWLQKESLRLVIIAVPFIFLALFWNDLPEHIPLHWNLQGGADGYGSKFAFLGLAGINLLLLGLFFILPHLDPKEKSLVLFQDKWQMMQVIMHLFVTYLFFIIGFTALGYQLPVDLVVKYGMIGLILTLGSYIGNTKFNKYFGIKTPWTLSSKYVWQKTHRFTSQVWVLSSLLMLIYDFWHKTYAWAFFVYLGVLVVAPVIYSYLIYKNQPKTNIPSEE